MKKLRVLKYFYVYFFIILLISSLTVTLTSCCNINYFIKKISEFNNKKANDSYDTTTSNTPDLDANKQSAELLQNNDTSNDNTNSADKITEGKNIDLIIEYHFGILGDTSKIDFITVIPNNYEDRQKISGIDYSIIPEKIFTDGPNKYAEFIILDPLSDFELKITAKLEIYEYDLERAMLLEKDQVPENNFSEYLKEEKYIEVNNPVIQNMDLVHILTEYPLDHVKMNYDYVMENLDYFEYNPGDVGAVRTLKNKGGDCTDYTDTFVALCRASGFPARSIEGYPTDAIDLAMGHNWSEIFINGYGWVPFDPTYDDNNGSSQNSTFKNLENKYIYMSFIRNDAILGNYHYYFYNYWGDNLSVDRVIYISTN